MIPLTTPVGCREGLSTRPVGGSDEIQLSIDPMDLDDEISGLHGQVRRLRNVCSRFFRFLYVSFFFK